MNAAIEKQVMEPSVPDLTPFRLFEKHELAEPDPRYGDFLLAIHEHFSKREDYVGISAYGSQFTGVVTPESDFDFIMIAGENRCDSDNVIMEQADQIAKKFGKTTGIPHINGYHFYEANFVQPNSSRSEYYHAGWELAYPFFGNQQKIDRLRGLLRKRHLGRKLVDPGHAKRSIREAVFNLMFFEIGICWPQTSDHHSETFRKISSRGHLPLEVREVVIKRRAFWMDRMSKLFGEE